jgi:hypothetical protein
MRAHRLGLTIGSTDPVAQRLEADLNRIFSIAARFLLTNGDKGDITVTGINTWTIDANVVDDTKLRDSAALSVIGRSANSTGDPADIAAASDGQVLRRAASVLGFGALDLDSANSVTGTLGVANGGTDLASGTSGGVLAFTGATTLASSGALTANGVVRSRLTVSCSAVGQGRSRLRLRRGPTANCSSGRPARRRHGTPCQATRRSRRRVR